MGELLLLHPRRVTSIRQAPGTRPAFFFDVSCPLSYLAAEHIERTFGELDWMPVSGTALRGGRSEAESAQLRRLAEEQADELHLPLVWPERFSEGAPRALRAAAYAAGLGAGPRFALAAGRLAFCGGFALDDPETLAEAAAAAAIPLRACLEAAGDPRWDLGLRATAAGLLARAVRELPVMRSGERWFAGRHGWRVAATVLRPAAPSRFTVARQAGPDSGPGLGPGASITTLTVPERAVTETLAPAG